ncbi:hypothetical protein BHU72_13670 [Desulfuribacillus stibiiarsenatis]|uniref:Sodium-dependent bicarbonate transport family permease n=1 Tax=Desulfuribacillus stibiiarsenatis TaxID=1390249 RepID=A0A1E5L8J8_9FIRM|nr:sodium-dependent bicarbonate transport family permease [Desulfuribacillus stibiiarsenatis]OEH86461.1 hypothetical protein BHU72_13670 [Desulfuribacillus stibiiarsenatis]
MDSSVILSAILSPFILFFILGYLVIGLRSDIRFPPAMSQGMMIFLLLAIGLGGGVKVADAIANNASQLTLLVSSTIYATLAGALIAVVAFFVTYKLIRLDATNAGAIAVHNGAVSTATMILGLAFLAEMPYTEIPFAVVLYPFMDVPALVTGITLGTVFATRDGVTTKGKSDNTIGKIVLESLAGKGVFLIIAGVIIGVISGVFSPKSTTEVMNLFDGLFKGVLCLYLMEMGMIAASRLGELWEIRKQVGKVVVYAVIFPFVIGPALLLIGWAIGFDPYLAVFVAIIGASSSYVSAPAACRAALPKANPSLYVGQSLGIIFPLNVIVNIPFVLLPLSRLLYQ